jgi:hypothetical protein
MVVVCFFIYFTFASGHMTTVLLPMFLFVPFQNTSKMYVRHARVLNKIYWILEMSCKSLWNTSCLKKYLHILSFYSNKQDDKIIWSGITHPLQRTRNYFKVASVVLGPKFSSMKLYLIDIPPDHRCRVNVQFMLRSWNLKKPQTVVALGLRSICFSSKLRTGICKMVSLNFGQQMAAVVEQENEDFHI